ncbi:MAG: histone deacetylase [Desulfatibacillaceae bacterium]
MYMRRTGFLCDKRYLLHETGEEHPECARRLNNVYKAVRDSGLLEAVVRIKPAKARPEQLELVHTREYILRFEDACKRGQPFFDTPDNRICKKTYSAALLAAGGVLKAVDMVMSGKLDNAFCAVRPPGHHALPGTAMGFCFFNNVAIAARHLQHRWNVARVGIVDFDVHHGNGTQDIFEADPTVYYYSIHQHPSFAFPGSGREFETGTGAGVGYTLNTPMLPGRQDRDYMSCLERDLVPAFEVFQPDFVLVSAGFDAHAEDDMADMELTDHGFAWIARRIRELADMYCGGRMVSILEGGYCLPKIGELCSNHLNMLLRD